MNKVINILLTVLAVLLLIAFAYLTTSPTITEDAYQEHMNGGSAPSTEKVSGDDFSFLEDMGEEDPFAFLDDLEDEAESDESYEEEDPFAFLDDF